MYLDSNFINWKKTIKRFNIDVKTKKHSSRKLIISNKIIIGKYQIRLHSKG